MTIFTKGQSCRMNCLMCYYVLGKEQVAIACDTEEMYLRVGIAKEDRRYHRCHWDSTHETARIYEFNRLVFGIHFSPYLAQIVSRENAK